MRLNVETSYPWDVEADVLAVPVPSDIELPEYLAELDRRLGGAIESMRTLGAIKGTLWEARLIPAADMGVRFVLAVGVGDGRRIDRLGARRLGAVIVRSLTGCDVRRLAVHVPDQLDRAGRRPAGSRRRARHARPRRGRRGAIHDLRRPGRPPAAGARRVHLHGRVGRRRRPLPARRARPDHRRRQQPHAPAGAARRQRRQPRGPRRRGQRRGPPVRHAAQGHRSGGSRRHGHGHVHGRGPRFLQPAALHRPALRAGDRSATRAVGCWPWSARASPSTPAASASSRPPTWAR